MRSDQEASQAPALQIPQKIAESVQPIAAEVHRIHEAAVWSAQGQFEQMKLWRSMNMVLGVPAAVLAAISGGTGLAKGQVSPVPAVLALIAGGFSAALTTLNPSRRVAQAQAAANAYLGVQTSARQLLTIDLLTMTNEEARRELETLTARREEVNATADPPSRYAYWRAKKSIGGGGQHYEADRG